MPIIQMCDKKILCKTSKQRGTFRKRLEKFDFDDSVVKEQLEKSKEKSEKFIQSERIYRHNLEAKLATVVIGKNVKTR